MSKSADAMPEFLVSRCAGIGIQTRPANPPASGRPPSQQEETSPMDLGIAGRKAIVCASSRGLGRACAQALAAAGCEVVINGRDAKALEATAAELQKATGARII